MRRSPDRRENLLMGDDTSGVLGEKRQQLEFLRCQLDFIARARRAVAYGIDFEPADLQHRDFSLTLHTVAQRSAHPREEFTDVERLVDVIVGAQIERLDLLRFTLA